jgi:DNA-directed RNA polymerase specialized sigma24 family protein
VLVLRFVAGLTIEEIAELTGDPPTTVRRRLGRAAAALGAVLEDAP